MEQIVTTFISQGIFVALVGYLLSRGFNKLDNWIDKTTDSLTKLTTMTAVHEVEIENLKVDIAEIKGEPKVRYKKK